MSNADAVATASTVAFHQITFTQLLDGTQRAQCTCGWWHHAPSRLECELQASVHDIDQWERS